MDMSVEEDGLFIVDTDCGSDDAMAINLALTECPSQVVAFTCCFGNTTVDNVCKNVMRVMVVCNQINIPVFQGSGGPLIVRNEANIVHGSDGLGDCSHEYPTCDLKVEDEPATIAMIRLTKKYPGQITLVVLGPLTNAALAHRVDPDFTKRLKRIVCMGGNYKGVGNTTETAEFNFHCDPEAAHIILTEAACPIVLVTWETTLDHGIEWDEYEKMMNVKSKKAEFLKRATAVVAEYCHQDNLPYFVDCDLLAVFAALYPRTGIQQSIKREMAVECRGEFSTGLCICRRKSATTSEGKTLIEIIQHFNVPLLNKLRRSILND